MTNLKQSYESICNEYIKAFAEKHEYECEPYSPSEIMCFGDYYVSMATIRTDIDMDAKEDEFIKWYDYTLRLGMLDCSGIPNFESWLKRCPIRSEEEILAMEATRRKIEDLENELKKMCEE